MHPRAPEIVAAVRACLGTRFRPQGRTPGLALDCIGVALVAASAAHAILPDAAQYTLGGDHEHRLDAALAVYDRVAADWAMPGDLLVFAPAAGRRHLAIQVAPALIVHAHAGLRRVVEGPIEPAWALVGIWRFSGEA